MTPIEKLRYHVTGAIERGEKTAIVEVTVQKKQVAVVDNDTFKVIARLATIAEAEAFVHGLSINDPAKVYRGGYGIDAPEEMINGKA